MYLNNTTTDEYQDASVTNNVIVQIIFYVLYTMIFFLGLLGNALVCYIVSSNKAMQTVTNMFIMNLALSDILLCLVIPFTPLYTFMGRWVFGLAICHLVPYAQATSVYVSSLTLTAIAIDRFFVILYPLQQRMKFSTCNIILVSIWMISMLVTLPYAICMQLYLDKDKQGREREVCEENWSLEHFEIVFGCTTLVLQFVLPFCIITYCYLRISRRLSERSKSKPGTKNARKEEADKEKKRRTNRMLMAMVAIFGVCWLPLNLINVSYDFSSAGSYFHLFFFMAHCLAVSSTCYNPFLYAWLNENFRKEFKRLLPCIARNIASRYNCANNEHTLDTLLHSTVISTTTNNKLEPREPTAHSM